ncbi:MAG TPA: helix-turn-helix transcriptional regulator [Acidimicrobiales bacterium]|nr:helix-turn-helix transcriptional regulator [Acidimicrobiales bacterium]
MSPRLLAWARERSGLEVDELATRFPKLTEWESGERAPTLKQLEDLARATHTPVGFLFLSEPPEEQVPIPDYRTMDDVGVRRPSPDLLDTIFECQQRQEWYRDFAQVTREDPVAFVGSLTTSVPVVEAAEQIRATLRFDPGERGHTWSDALRTLVDHAEELGVLVMVSGVVGANTHHFHHPSPSSGSVACMIFLAVISLISSCRGIDTERRRPAGRHRARHPPERLPGEASGSRLLADLPDEIPDPSGLTSTI